jgi:hypothetical protein
MTIIDDSLAVDHQQSVAAAEPAGPGRPRRRGMLATGAAIVVAGGLAVAAVQITGSTNSNDQPRPASPSDDHVVVGSGPHAVYVGPAPKFGGDPVRGETDDSYFARTGRHLPGLSSALLVDGPWWYGPAPVVGGDPVPGETDDSYFGRTGRHLPAQVGTP